MTGRRQLDAYVRAHPDPASLPVGRFTVTGRKVACVLCGRDGYGPVAYDPNRTYPVRERGHRVLLQFIDEKLVQVEGPDTAPEPPHPMPWWVQYRPWQIGCFQDHVWPCSCGKTFPSFVNLWRHLGADRPNGWGRQSEHHYALAEAWPREAVAA